MIRSVSLYPTLLFILLFTVVSCKKEQAGCASIKYVGDYSGILEQTNNDPNFNTEIYANENCEIFIDFCPDLGHHTRIEISGNQVVIPLQTQTFYDIITYDSLANWQLQTTGTGTYNNGTIILNYTKKSNFYNSTTFEHYSSNSVTLTLQL